MGILVISFSTKVILMLFYAVYYYLQKTVKIFTSSRKEILKSISIPDFEISEEFCVR